MHNGRQEVLDFVLKGIAKITWLLPCVSYAYPQLGLKKTPGGY
jgi:hypothetical protein